MAIFDCATWRPVVNHGGPMADEWGVVMHQQVSYGSLFGYFNDPASQVSAHFWVSQSGTIEQYVDSETVAWHGLILNLNYCGIEFEGMPTDAITPAQVDAGGLILAEGNRRHGWPFLEADANGQRGFGYHRMAVATACPSDLRLSARPAILAAAQGPAPGPPPKGAPMASDLWGYVDAQGRPHVFYQSDGDHLFEAVAQQGGTWNHYDQTVNTGAGNKPGPPLAS